MPTTAGVYIAALENGTEVSSTYEGRHLTMVEDELMHPLHADVFVNKGDPVVIARALGATPHTAYGLAVGVAFNDGAALTDLIAIDTEGIWNLNVNAFDDNGGVDVNPGDALFISDDSAGTDDSSHDGVGNCVISKIRNNAIQIPFGYALGYIAASAYGVIAVKVHWDPRAHWLLDDEMLYFGDARDVSIEWNAANLEILPLTDDTGSILIGNATHHVNSVQIFGIGVASYLQYITAVGQFNHFNTTVGANAQAEQHEFTQATPTMPDGMGVIENQLTLSGVAVGPFTTLESNWINIGAGGVAHGYMGIRNDGIWSGGDISDAYVYMQKYSYLPDSDANWVSIWELNWAGTDPVIDAIFNVNDPTLALGYVAGGAAEADVPIGYCPFFSTAHGALMGYVYIFAHP